MFTVPDRVVRVAVPGVEGCQVGLAGILYM
jgi:hypothetical protein